MLHILGSIIGFFFFWLFFGLLGDWALWWNFSQYIAFTGDVVDGIRKILIDLGREFKSR